MVKVRGGGGVCTVFEADNHIDQCSTDANDDAQFGVVGQARRVPCGFNCVYNGTFLFEACCGS